MNVHHPGFRARHIIAVTTFLDDEKYPKDGLTRLYRARWKAELDLQALKVDLQMDILRCNTLEMVRKEFWTHILAYKMVRTMMTQAVSSRNIQPRTISFEGAKQTLEVFQLVITWQRDANQR